MVRVFEDKFGCMVNPVTNRLEMIRRFTICNKIMSVQVINYGATITSVNMPDSRGKLGDVCLGFDNINGYLSPSNPYIGALIGRVCSRVGNGRFDLNGRYVEVSKNFMNKHQLHGGYMGFDKVVWDVLRIRPDGVTFSYLSPDGHEGYPGQVYTKATYTLTEDNCFRLCIEAVTTKPTPVNMTSHAYFNLAGHAAGKKAMMEHMVKIKANKFTEMDEDTIPNGNITDVEGHPLDLRKLRSVGVGIRPFLPKGYDHNYIVDHKPGVVTSQGVAFHPPTGRWLEVSSNQPCMHFYTSHNMPDVEDKGEAATILGKCGAQYTKHGSFCMEPHAYPNAMNHNNFPSVILSPGEKYCHVCIFKFGICKKPPTGAYPTPL